MREAVIKITQIGESDPQAEVLYNCGFEFGDIYTSRNGEGQYAIEPLGEGLEKTFFSVTALEPERVITTAHAFGQINLGVYTNEMKPKDGIVALINLRRFC